MNTGDTIAAVASGPGAAPVAVLRLSGPAVPAALADLFGADPARRCCTRAHLRLAPDLPVPVRLIRFMAPRSATGQHAADILLPGQPHLVQRTLARVLALPGLRHAEPGEFSARAYLAGRLTLEQAEAVSALIAADNAAQLDAAQRLMRGEPGQHYADWHNRLARLLALVEAGIDFTDQEDVVPISPADLLSAVRALRDAIGALVHAASARQARHARPLVVLAGAPNAGKSTLFNALLRRRRAVESPIAGSTRDALVEPLTLVAPDAGELTIDLADLPGLDAAIPTAPASVGAQLAGRRAIDEADVILACRPAGDPPPSLPPAPNARILPIATKADRPTPAHDPHAPPGELPICALDGRGLSTLRRALFDAAWSAGPGLSRDLLPRHRAALHACHAALAALADDLAPIAGARALPNPELTADALRSALDALDPLTGRLSPDDILGRIFASFCIGK
ncbi:MAG: 50S ribosome-binding GTPase [Phycisphaeraceae bacterium]|nr:50S ribosome-binding GTPase [Phycisphaeraceae bacterium]